MIDDSITTDVDSTDAGEETYLECRRSEPIGLVSFVLKSALMNSVLADEACRCCDRLTRRFDVVKYHTDLVFLCCLYGGLDRDYSHVIFCPTPE